MLTLPSCLSIYLVTVESPRIRNDFFKAYVGLILHNSVLISIVITHPYESILCEPL